MLACFDDVPDAFCLSGVWRIHLEQLGEAKNRVQGSTQLMTHPREEFALRPVGGLGLRLRTTNPFLGMMPLSFAQADVNRDDIRVLSLPGASFLETVWLFHNKDTVNPVVGPALECVSATRDSLLSRRSIA